MTQFGWKTTTFVQLATLTLVFMSDNGYNPETLDEDEIFWRDRYHFFKSRGYILRPRYHPNWEPSWKSDTNPIVILYEDCIRQIVGYQTALFLLY